MQGYLEQFHKTKDIFLKFQASKASRNKADLISKELTAKNEERNEQPNGRTAAQKARSLPADKEERAFLVDEALVEDSHFNFPKIHLMIHWADQISRYECLPQFFTEICETSHRALKDVYRQSNHVDSIPQIIKGYTRKHNFVVRQLEFEAWAGENESFYRRLVSVLCLKRRVDKFTVTQGEKVHMTLGGPRSIKEIYNLHQLAEAFSIPELQLQTRVFFEANVCSNAEDPESDAQQLLAYASVKPYIHLQIPIPDQDMDNLNSYNLQHLRTTGKQSWRGKKSRRDSVWVCIDNMMLRVAGGQIPSYQGRIPGFLNALFTEYKGGALYKLAHVTIMSLLGNPTPHGPEGMSYVARRSSVQGEYVAWVRNIKGAVHLVPVEPDHKWVVNNRVDYYVWNEMNDGK